jgi:hypothetical protein
MVTERELVTALLEHMRLMPRAERLERVGETLIFLLAAVDDDRFDDLGLVEAGHLEDLVAHLRTAVTHAEAFAQALYADRRASRGNA